MALTGYVRSIIEKQRSSLVCEQNTRAAERKIRSAFRHWSKRRSFETFFEHGQWWVRQPAGTTFSVCDSNTGFCFEQID